MNKHIGEQYNSLTVVAVLPGKGRKRYLFNCNCGDTREALLGNVKNGSIKACVKCTAIRVSRQNSAKSTRHGGSSSSLYQSWKCMKSRCKDTTHPYYGKLNITYTTEWESFEGFKAWAEANNYVEGLTIDRIDPTKGYYPNNCQWLTREENSARANKGRIPWNKRR